MYRDNIKRMDVFTKYMTGKKFLVDGVYLICNKVVPFRKSGVVVMMNAIDGVTPEFYTDKLLMVRHNELEKRVRTIANAYFRISVFQVGYI